MIPVNLAESIALNAQIGQTMAANGNVSNAVSFSQTQDGYLQQVGAALDQMSTLAVEAQDPTKTTKEIADYDAEFSALGAYINNTANATFNGVSLFGSAGLTITTDGVNGSTFTMTAVNLGTGTSYATAAGDHITSATVAAASLTAVTSALTHLATDRSNLGANEERLTYSGNELGVLADNLTAANSTITNVDVATESTKYAEYQILVQSGTSMLAQANQNPQSVLKLLQ